MSKEQDILREHILNVLPQNKNKILENIKPNFLRNEKTGKNLEIDIYLLSYNVGIEYQGGVHFKYIHRFKNNVDKKRLYDTMKADMTLKSTTPIIELFESDLTGCFSEKFLERIENVQKYYFMNKKLKQVKKLQELKRDISPADEFIKHRKLYGKIKYKLDFLFNLQSINSYCRAWDLINMHFLSPGYELFDRKFYEKYIEKNLHIKFN